MRMTTVSSGLMTTQALISGVAPWARAALGPPNGMSRPSASPPPAAAAPIDEGTAIDFRNVVHGCLPLHALAAAWIASRTCWKVPQRQMLVMVLLMSASVGFGFSLSSAATAMIMPHWQ